MSRNTLIGHTVVGHRIEGLYVTPRNILVAPTQTSSVPQ